MKKKIKEVINHPLISGSTVMVVGLFIANTFNYLFNVAMGRYLSVVDYGTLASLVSIISIFSIFSSTIITVFTKYTASSVGQNKNELIGPLFRNGNILVGIGAFIVCLLIFIFSSEIIKFLNISSLTLVYITILSLFFILATAVPFGILQGSLKFFSLSLINIFTTVTKLILGLILVTTGLKVLGAVIATLISNIACYLLAFVHLRSFLKSKNTSIGIHKTFKKVSPYAISVLLSSLGLTAMISIDIILTKHFVNPVVAGQYAALSLMGRSIFYIVAPITSVFFSLVAQKKERGENLFGTISIAASLIGLPTLILCLVYFIYPNLILQIFFPAKEYKALAPHLGPFSIFILFYSLCWLLNSFYLSIGKIKVYILTILALFSEIVLIIFFHYNIADIIKILVITSFALLIGLILYFPLSSKGKVSLKGDNIV